MAFLKSFMSLKSSGLFMFVMLACLVFYLSTNPVQNIQEYWLRKTDQYRLEREELGKVLKKASMPDRTVILTTLNEAWADPGSVIDLFLESFRVGEGTPRLLNHLVIVSMDQQAFNRCKAIHPHCYSLTTAGVNFSAEKRFMTPDYLKLMWRRIEFLRIVLELGYNFVFTDADIMWFRDPFPYFDSLDEIQIACDFYKGKPRDEENRANGGFNYVKAVGATIEFYKFWYMARINHPNLHDQAVFEIIKHEPIVHASGLRIKYLDTMYFGGFCQPSKDMNKVCTMHANCCVGIEKKIHDLGLILHDWKNFTSLPPEQKKAIGSSSSPWSAPSKCKKW
ncbi:Glycosyltransferase [Thalictrum thalictroides]|uniref:Glycosyltransferase n=1 Tax=Thalictrum thalictroides TaxID=46969 RepID=A0A7J6X3W5_THATH|nr:Glycosyltransferase [Thalictrum thalictroides]